MFRIFPPFKSIEKDLQAARGGARPQGRDGRDVRDGAPHTSHVLQHRIKLSTAVRMNADKLFVEKSKKYVCLKIFFLNQKTPRSGRAGAGEERAGGGRQETAGGGCRQRSFLEAKNGDFSFFVA